MKSITVARNYAEALFAAGENYGELIDAVAGAVQADLDGGYGHSQKVCDFRGGEGMGFAQ